MENIELIITLIVGIVGSNGLWTFLMSKRKGKSALEQGVLALLHEQLYQNTEVYLERGAITMQELDNLHYLYAPYSALNGNGEGKIRYEKCLSLPVISEEELKSGKW